MKLLPLSLLALAFSLPGAAAAGPDVICVGPGSACLPTLEAAVAASANGGTIRLGKGVFAGDVTIDKNVNLVGAGARLTRIEGGGPVLTIGAATAGPTVVISALTITGGLTHTASRCGPSCGAGYVTATALGGGIEALPGTTVTIASSVIAHNRVAPSSTVPSVRARCPGGPCRAALAGGGGIDNWGRMTLTNTTVSDNEVGGAASDADGGGILNEAGDLTLVDSTVTGNRAVASPPYGRFAEGGGIFLQAGALTIRGGAVDGNSVGLSSSFAHPYPRQGGITDQTNANSGGIHAGDGGSVTIDNAQINHNTITVEARSGEAIGFDSAVCMCGSDPLTLSDSTVDGNVVTVTVATTADAGPAGSTLELDADGTITDTRITNNTARVTSRSGIAGVVGAVGVFGYQGRSQKDTITGGVISGNEATALSASGSVTEQGAGLLNNGPLVLQNVRITGNIGAVAGPKGWAHGGGVFNGKLFAEKATLTLRGTTISGNSLKVASGLTAQGAGLYTPGWKVTTRSSEIAGNTPDQCYGC